MSTSEAIRVRDALNELVRSVEGETDQETEIIRCCLAVGVEELEKWMYDGEFTPSVAPAIDITGEDPNSLGLRLPKHWTDAEREFFGAGMKIQFIKAVREAIKPMPELKDALAYFNRMKAQFPELWKAKFTDLDYRQPEHWTDEEKEAFRHGKVIAFIKAVRTKTGEGLKPAKAYFDRMKREHADKWAIDTDGGI